MNADFDDARRGLERLAFYAQAETAGVEIQRLGGLTNRVFMVSGPRGRHVLRIPGKGTEAYINRRVEAVAARAAARAGVSPEVIATGRRTFDDLLDTIVRCQQAGLLPAGDPRATAGPIWSLLHGISMLTIGSDLAHVGIDEEAEALTERSLRQMMF